jgi:hypothetical protein
MRMVRSEKNGIVVVSSRFFSFVNIDSHIFLLYRYNLLAKKLRIVTKNAGRNIGLVTSHIALQNVRGPHRSNDLYI